MDATIQAVLDSSEARYAKESQLMRSEPMDRVMARRDEFLLPVGAETGTILNLLIKGANAYQRRVRELDFDSVLLPVGSGVELSRRH